MLAVVAAHLWLGSTVPLRALAESGYDDALFVRLAVSFLDGDWLGSYDNLTLAKGPIYSVWIALIAWIGIPLLVAQSLVYLAAGLIFCRAVAPALKHWWLVVGLFAVYALNPMITATPHLRVVREGLYTPLTVLIMSCVVWWWHWRHRGIWHRIVVALALGALLALYWMTREESLYLLPVLAIGWLLTLLATSKQVTVVKTVARECSVALVCVVTVMVGTYSVASINHARYGIREVVEFRQDEFVSAYGALSRIRHAEWRRLVVVPYEVLRRAGKVSPAAAELLPHFEGPAVEIWKEDDGTIHGALFMWALRAVVDAAGYYETATKAASFYARLAAEIDAACADNRLDCHAPRKSLAPPFRLEYVRMTLDRFFTAAWRLMTFAESGVRWSASTGRALDLEMFSNLVGGPIFPLARQISFRGRVITGEGGVAAITVLSPQNKWHQHTVQRTPLISIVDRDGRTVEHAVDFDLTTDCNAPDCRLEVYGADGVLASIRFDAIQDRVKAGDTTVLIYDLVDSQDRSRPRDPRADASIKILNAIAGVYRILGPLMGIIALVAFAGSLAVAAWTRRWSVLFFINAVLLAAVFSRVLLLSYMDVVALPSVNSLYMSPIVPLWLLFTVLALVAAGQSCVWITSKIGLARTERVK